MPKYTFKCPDGHTTQLMISSDIKTFPCTENLCFETMTRQLPVLNGPSNVTEIINKTTGVAWRPDQKEEVKQRREEYYWTVEVPRLVASGTYALDTMLENGWIWVDDNKQIHVNTKPPAQR
jgi:hypothetical protein